MTLTNQPPFCLVICSGGQC